PETLDDQHLETAGDCFAYASRVSSASDLGYLGGLHAAGRRSSWSLALSDWGTACGAWRNLGCLSSLYPIIVGKILTEYVIAGGPAGISCGLVHRSRCPGDGQCWDRCGLCADSRRWFYVRSWSAADDDHDLAGRAAFLA